MGYTVAMGDMFTESTSQLVARGLVKTSSRMYKTWLSMVRGYEVEKRMQTPKGYSLGRLTYRTSWVLKPTAKK